MDRNQTVTDRNQTVLYEDFQRARLAAIEETDLYRDVSFEDPRKEALWCTVVSRTEVAERLLKLWLRDVHEPVSGLHREPERAVT